MPICQNCGSNRMIPVGELTAFGIWRCEICGFEEMIHVELVLDNETKNVKSVYVGYSSKPTPKQIQEARKIFESLNNISLTDMYKKYQNGEEFDIGYFPEEKIDNLKEQLKKFGMEIKRLE